MSLSKNIELRGFKDILSPRKWLVYIRYLIARIIGGVFISNEDLLSYCEQVVYRSIMCSDCVRAGECHHCGCKMPEAIADSKNYCSAGNWLQMFDEEVWVQYKKDHGMQLDIVFHKEIES